MDIASPNLTTLPAAEPVYSLDQLAARAQTAKRRAAAMVSDWDYVAGLALRPLCPRTYSRLMVVDSPFLRGSAAASRADVRTYCWIHSPTFTESPQNAPAARAELLRQLDDSIDPPWQRWRRSRAARSDLVAAGWAIAASEIAELIEVAFADMPPSKGENDGRAPVASFEAQMIDVMATAYPVWPLATAIRETPLRILYQLMRCQNGVDYDADEAAVIAADLAARNSR